MNQYAPKVSATIVPVNYQLLLQAGLTKAEADTFAFRTYAALPAWLRARLKATANPKKQAPPRKLRPVSFRDFTFYINPQRFPAMKVTENQAVTPAARRVEKGNHHLQMVKTVANGNPAVERKFDVVLRKKLLKVGVSFGKATMFAKRGFEALPADLREKVAQLDLAKTRALAA